MLMRKLSNVIIAIQRLKENSQMICMAPLQYGNGLRAFIINLLICQMVTLNRTQKMIKSLVGQILCEATLLKFIWRLHEVLGYGN